MAAPYSLDLRRKVVQACRRPGQSQRTVAEFFGVSLSFSPDYSPIEPCWSKLKTCLRAIKARTREALDEALSYVIETVTASDAKGWFKHCGYAFH